MPDKKSPNPSLTKAYIAAIDDQGIPYADGSGREDTNTYLEPPGQNDVGSWVWNWFKDFTESPEFLDNDWLPTKPGDVIFIPEELIPYIPIPDGWRIKPGPDFTPLDESPVPSVIIELIPTNPRNPRPIPDQIDKPKTIPPTYGMLPRTPIPNRNPAPRLPRPSVLPRETLPPTM